MFTTQEVLEGTHQKTVVVRQNEYLITIEGVDLERNALQREIRKRNALLRIRPQAFINDNVEMLSAVLMDKVKELTTWSYIGAKESREETRFEKEHHAFHHKLECDRWFEDGRLY